MHRLLFAASVAMAMGGLPRESMEQRGPEIYVFANLTLRDARNLGLRRITVTFRFDPAARMSGRDDYYSEIGEDGLARTVIFSQADLPHSNQMSGDILIAGRLEIVLASVPRNKFNKSTYDNLRLVDATLVKK